MKVIKVKNLKKVDVTKYIEGSLFMTDKEISILASGQLDPLIKQSDLKKYVTKSQVEKMLKDIKKGE